MRLCGISSRFQLLSPCMRQVTHALLTRPPLSHSSFRGNQSASFDLHVLSTPPAFILSQDQTLMLKVFSFRTLAWLKIHPTSCYTCLLFFKGPRFLEAFARLSSRLEISFESFKVFHCLVINVHLLLCLVGVNFDRLSCCANFVNNFFHFF